MHRSSRLRLLRSCWVLVLALGCAPEAPPTAQASVEGLELAELQDTDAAQAPDALPADAPPAPEALAVDRANGHVSGPLGTRRLYFHGVARSTETRNLESGLRLTAYVAKRVQEKLGDAVFDDGRWWFDDDDRLRQQSLWLNRTTPTLCASAATQLSAEYGLPTRDRANEKVWVGAAVMARWTQRDADRGAVRCQVEWLDLTYFGA